MLKLFSDTPKFAVSLTIQGRQDILCENDKKNDTSFEKFGTIFVETQERERERESKFCKCQKQAGIVLSAISGCLYICIRKTIVINPLKPVCL